MTQGALYCPIAEQRRMVKGMSGLGVPHERIAVLLDLDAKTLRKHYRAELDRGSAEATAKVAQSLFQMATTGKNVAAAIFWMKARAGWREKHEVEGTTRPVKELTDAQLETIIALCQEATAESEGQAGNAEGRVLKHEADPEAAGPERVAKPARWDIQHRSTTVGRW